MKKIFLLGFLLGTVFLIGAQDKVVTAAADPWPPFVDPNNPTQGLSLEIVRAALGSQGYKVDMKIIPWARAEEGVKAGEIDILPNTWMTEARKQSFLYSDAYASNEIKFIKRKGDPFEYTGMASLKGKRVGVVRGYGYGDEFLGSTSFKKEEGADLVENVKKLVASRFDLTLEDQIVASSLLKEKAPALLDAIEYTKNALSTNKLYVTSGVANPRGKEIVDAFNKGLASITASGKLKEIFKNYGIK